MPSRFPLLLSFALVVTSFGFAQTPAPKSDVTSVKPFVPPAITVRMFADGTPDNRFAGPGCTGGRFYARIMTQPIILWAYDVKYYQLSGMPDWKGESWEIEGRTSEGKVSPENCRLMAQALLEDRFKLVVHREKRDVPVQALVVAKSGPKLQKATGEPGTGARLKLSLPVRIFGGHSRRMDHEGSRRHAGYRREHEARRSDR